jgi:DnaJ-class molecular chaperone
MVEAAFSGFAQLPAARVALRPWWEVLGCTASTSTEGVTIAYRSKAKLWYQDRNVGDEDAKAKYFEVDDAYTRFKKERGL